jgi:hypothetical protein
LHYKLHNSHEPAFPQIRAQILLFNRNCEELFADARANAGVLFASIPNFTEFYSEDINEGVECIRNVCGEKAKL